MRSTTFPSRGLGALRRGSSLMYSWDARDLSLTARTGQVITLPRPGDGTAIDGSGRIRRLVHSQSRWEWIDTGGGILEPHLLVEGARTNTVLHKRDLTHAVWVKTNCTAALDQVGIDGRANAASSLLATAANATCIQNITAGSNQRVQSVDVWRLAGNGTIQLTGDGTTFTTIAVTAAKQRFSLPPATLANPKPGLRIVTNGDKIGVDWVTNEVGAHPSSRIGSLADNATAEPRSAEVCTSPFLAPPRDMTVYVRFVERGTLLTPGTNGLFAIGESANAAFFCFNASGSYEILHRRAVDTNTFVATPPSTGQLTELACSLYADGSVQMEQALSGGAGVLAGRSGANPLADAWSKPTLTIGGRDSGSTGFAAFSQIKIAAGVRSLASMRAAV